MPSKSDNLTSSRPRDSLQIPRESVVIPNFLLRMKPASRLLCLLGFALTVGLGRADDPTPTAATKTSAEPAKAQKEEAPASDASEDSKGYTITIENLPLVEAISHLAKVADLNILIDPRLNNPALGPDGKPLPPATVSIRFENVSAKQALEALLLNHDMQLVEDSKTMIHRIVKKDPAAKEPLITSVFQLRYSNPTNLASVVSSSLPAGAKIFAEPRTSQMIITATARETSEITNLLAHLDVSNRQILIEAQFFETLKNPRSIKGIDWSGTLAAQNISMGNGITSGSSTTTSPGVSTTTTLPSGRTITSASDSSTASSVTTAIGDRTTPGMSFNTASGLTPGLAFLNADGVKATLSFLNTDTDSDSIAAPTTVALEGEEAKLVVVRNVPVFEEQQGQISGSGGQSPSSVKPNYDLTVKGEDRPLNEVGIKLLVTPRVVADANVLLLLKPEISTVEANPERKTLGGKINESPIFSRRSINTRAIVPSGNTLVLGGLNSDESTKNYSKVPLLGDLPLLGRLFRKDEKIRNKRNLLIFVTPTIIQEGDFQPNPDSKALLRTKKEDSLPDDMRKWESAKPNEKSKEKSKKP